MVGPVDTIADALIVLDSEDIAAAIVDYELADGDVSPLAEALSRKGIPFVIQSATAVPAEIAVSHSGVPVLIKPIQAQDVASVLGHHVRLKLSVAPEQRFATQWRSALAVAASREEKAAPPST